MQGAVRLAVEFAGRLHDDQLDRQFRDAALEGFEALGRVRHAEFLANGVEIDVEPVFTNIDANIEFRLRASFGRFLTLHAELVPNHLFRTSAKDGRTKLTHGSRPRGLRSRPPDARGMAIPRASAQIFANSRQSEHARGLAVGRCRNDVVSHSPTAPRGALSPDGRASPKSPAILVRWLQTQSLARRMRWGGRPLRLGAHAYRRLHQAGSGLGADPRPSGHQHHHAPGRADDHQPL